MPPHIHHIETAQDNRIILSKGSKLENQHTRMRLGTLSWVYKPSDYLMVIGPGSPCWSYQSQDLRPAKTVRRHATVETGAYWTGWAIVVFFTTDGTSCQEIKIHCDCQSVHHTSA